jgi:hypothetical protein
VWKNEQTGCIKESEYGLALELRANDFLPICLAQLDLGSIPGAVRAVQVSAMLNSPINRTKRTEEEK